MQSRKLTAFISVVLCLLLTANISPVYAIGNSSEPDAVDSITITNISGILKGETLQLQASVETSGFFFESVEWSSSNPNVISCTSSGQIKGLTAGKSATITCKAKIGSVNDSITVYCVEKLADSTKSSFENFITIIYDSPDPFFNIKTVCLNFKSVFGLFYKQFYGILRAFVPSNILLGDSVSVCGKAKNYAYIRYGDSNSQDGFVSHSALSKKITGFLNLSAEDMNVWGNGIANEDKKLTVSYNGNIKWTYDKDYVDFDEKTGQVIGLKPGTTTITATADGMSASCTIHLLYKWPQEWVAKTNEATYLYKAVGANYESRKALPKGTEITVYGDSSFSDGWAFARFTDGDDVWWGHIPIADISTKGTISQYRNLDWTWPVLTPEGKNKANFISSPYGERDRDPYMHKGFDITTGVSGEIKKYDVVSAFSGKVIYIDETSSTGYCVGIQSNITDPVSGQKMVAFYMHLYEQPNVKFGQKVEQGELLGKVGNTGNSGGYHLHFEVNNKNASIDDGSTARNYYAYLINPLFFFTDYTNNYIIGKESDKYKEGNENKIIIDETCSTVVSHFGAYWYGDDRLEE